MYIFSTFRESGTPFTENPSVFQRPLETFLNLIHFKESPYLTISLLVPQSLPKSAQNITDVSLLCKRCTVVKLQKPSLRGASRFFGDDLSFRSPKGEGGSNLTTVIARSDLSHEALAKGEATPARPNEWTLGRSGGKQSYGKIASAFQASQ